MPEKCCVPGCRGNYEGTAEHDQEKVSIFRFPKDPELRAKWIRLIPRENLLVHDKTVVCEKHFAQQFIIRFDRVTRTDGSILTVPRKNPKLSPDAYPSIFPNISSYLTSEPSRKRKAPEQRRLEMLAALWLSCTYCCRTNISLITSAGLTYRMSLMMFRRTFGPVHRTKFPLTIDMTVKNMEIVAVHTDIHIHHIRFYRAACHSLGQRGPRNNN